MPDVFTKAKRSEVMSRVRGHGNKNTELALAKLLRRHHITGWRRNQPLFGKPDFIFRQAHIAVFVDGCFWHGCPRHATKPKNNRAFWRRKFSRNKKRDLLVNRELRKLGWQVVRIWECSLQQRPMNCLRRIRQAIAAKVTRRQTEARRLRASAGAEWAAAKAHFERKLLGNP
jgi:DNA mismatch endonuclease (patch repair protein)